MNLPLPAAETTFRLENRFMQFELSWYLILIASYACNKIVRQTVEASILNGLFLDYYTYGIYCQFQEIHKASYDITVLVRENQVQLQD